MDSARAPGPMPSAMARAMAAVFPRNYSAVMPECFYRASRFPLTAPLDSR